MYAQSNQSRTVPQFRFYAGKGHGCAFGVRYTYDAALAELALYPDHTCVVSVDCRECEGLGYTYAKRDSFRTHGKPCKICKGSGSAVYSAVPGAELK